MIYLILLAALGIRLTGLNQSLWLDEAINVLYAQILPLSGYITSYTLGDFHPPGWFAILWIWTHLFGFSEIIIRLPSVIFGVLTVYLTYLIGKKISEKIGLISATLLCFSPLHLYYSQESRPYALAALSITLSFYFLIHFLGKIKLGYLFYGLALGTVFYSDYVAYLAIPTQAIYVLVYKKRLLKDFIKAVLIGLILFSPWLMLFPGQLEVGMTKALAIPGWKEVVGSINLNNLLLIWVKILVGKVSFENNFTYGLIVLLVSLPFIFLSIRNLQQKTLHNARETLLVLWLLVPVILAGLISFFIPILAYFRLIFILPAFYLLVAIWLNRLPKKLFLMLFLIIFSSNLIFSFAYLFNEKFHREDWREFVRFTDKKNNVVLFENSETPAPFLYYSKKNATVLAALNKIPAKSAEDLNIHLGNFEEIYLSEYLVEITDPKRLVETELKNLGFTKLKTYDFRGVGFVHRFKNAVN